MLELVYECHDFLNEFPYPYAICGGYAFEMFLGKQTRPHGDLDISIFSDDRQHIVDFMLYRGWNVYIPPNDMNYVKRISKGTDDSILNSNGVFAIKPGCPLFKLESIPGDKSKFKFIDTNKRQLNFDFIDIIFNQQQDNKFVFWQIADRGKNITRELDRAILHYEGIPYLSPEVMLFIISPQEYFDSEYHREKNCIDFESTVPHLPRESKKWLINALETVYPDGHRWFKQLKQE